MLLALVEERMQEFKARDTAQCSSLCHVSYYLFLMKKLSLNCSKHCHSRWHTHVSPPRVWRRSTSRSHLLSASVSIHTSKKLLSKLKHYSARLETRCWWGIVTVGDPFGNFRYLVLSRAELLWSRCIGCLRHCGELSSSQANNPDVPATFSQLLCRFEPVNQLGSRNHKCGGRAVE